MRAWSHNQCELEDQLAVASPGIGKRDCASHLTVRAKRGTNDPRIAGAHHEVIESESEGVASSCATLHAMRGPGSSRSNTTPGRNQRAVRRRAYIGHRRNLLPNCPDRCSFCAPILHPIAHDIDRPQRPDFGACVAAKPQRAKNDRSGMLTGDRKYGIS
jgi:hypothetical protein